MWVLVEAANGNEVRSTFKSAEEAALFIVKGGAHNFEWVGTKVTYIIKFEE